MYYTLGDVMLENGVDNETITFLSALIRYDDVLSHIAVSTLHDFVLYYATKYFCQTTLHDVEV